MKPHKHAELIKAWADGAEIQFFDDDFTKRWEDTKDPVWSETTQYRVKPHPKPDVVRFFNAYESGCSGYGCFYGSYLHSSSHNLKLTFDGETGKLKSAEVIV